MMKGFEKYGKLMGLMILACGLLFAGCMGSPSSSEEDAVADQTATSDEWIKVEFDPAGPSLTFGDGEQGAIGYFGGGHPVEIVNGSTGCAADADVSNCWVRMINRDPTSFMANVRIKTTACTLCTTATMVNADVYMGNTLHLPGPDGNVGASAPFLKAELAYVEDGMYTGIIYPNYYNVNGAPVHLIPQSQYKPFQVLAPACGSRSIIWDFGGQSTAFNYYVKMGSAQWKPWNVLNDAVYDGTNRTTYYVMLTDMYTDTKMTAVRKAWYRVGSYVRSNVIAGWSSPGSVSTVTLPNNRYFGVNVAVEYSDFIETQEIINPSLPSGGDDYAYYTMLTYILKYDPNQVTRVKTSGRMRSGLPLATPVVAGVMQVCSDATSCAKGKDTYSPFGDPAATTAFEDVAGYIINFMLIDTADFTFFGASAPYSTVYGGQVIAGTAGVMPGHMGQQGLVKMNMAGYPGYTGIIMLPSTAVIPDGADPEPDMPIAMYHFKVLGDSGLGSEFYTEQFSSYNQPELYYTNGTLIPGGRAHDVVFNRAPYVINRVEQSNPGITQSGPSVPGNGGYQAWHVNVCVQ